VRIRTQASIRPINLINYDSHLQRLDEFVEARPFRSMLTVDIMSGEIKHDEREKAGYWK